jgi:hypothetical protein
MSASAIPHDQRQPIEIIAPRPTDEAEQISALLSLFDAALEAHNRLTSLAKTVPGARRDYSGVIDISGDSCPHAEYAMRLYASGKGFRFEEKVFEYGPDHQFPHGFTIRALRLKTPDGDEILSASWHPAAKPAPQPANVITPPADTWRPADEVDDAATRFSLVEID